MMGEKDGPVSRRVQEYVRVHSVAFALAVFLFCSLTSAVERPYSDHHLDITHLGLTPTDGGFLSFGDFVPLLVVIDTRGGVTGVIVEQYKAGNTKVANATRSAAL